VIETKASRRKFHFIYKTKCLITGKYYFGMHSTNDLDDGYLGSGKRLRYSIRKYGRENHIREIFEDCSEQGREFLRDREALIVDNERLSDEKCLNLCVGGNAHDKYKRGQKCSEETCKKISEALRGRKLSTDHRQKLSEKKKGENHPFFGKSSPMKGKTHSAETRARLSAVTGEKHHAFGKKFSEEHRRKLSESHAGLKQSKETIEKRNSKLRGKKHSDETKAMLRERALRQWARVKNHEAV
jgi:NUMOD3 motif-containing protein